VELEVGLERDALERVEVAPVDRVDDLVDQRFHGL
jgi:hypothetical protein